MTYDREFEGYRGDLNFRCVTIAEVLKEAGYSTYMSGKWHVSRHLDGPKHSWPCGRGFDRFWGIIAGASSYWNPGTLTEGDNRIETPTGNDFFLTDAISDHAVECIREHAAAGDADSPRPFFSYVAYTAPHWPLHAHPEDIERYKGRFDGGWDVLRRERLERMVDKGIIHTGWRLTKRDRRIPEWKHADHKDWEIRRMAVYAAQIERMDRGIGRIVSALTDTGQLDNTLILFLSDNGGCAEELMPEWSEPFENLTIFRSKTRDGQPVQLGNDPRVMPGGEETYQSYGVPWANVSNTPFRLYKHWVHEGGIATPLIAHWPEGINARGELRHQPGQLTDIMATCLDVAAASYPKRFQGNAINPLEGTSLLPIFADRGNGKEALFWEHEGNRAVRQGKWKLVSRYPGDWELYDMDNDRTEMNDLSADHPKIVKDLSAMYDSWAARCLVEPWDVITSHSELGVDRYIQD
jgi:arylsulfatase